MRALLCAVVAVLVTAECLWAATGDPAIDALMEKLVEKRIITRDDARAVEQDLKKPVERYPGTPEPAQPAQVVTKPAQVVTQQETSKKPSKPKLPFEVKVRAQARLDHGDLLVGPDAGYERETDLFLRRVRLEVDKEFHTPPLGHKLDLNVTLEADRHDQDFRNGRRRNPGNRVDLQYLYADWIFADQFGLEIGKHKLPFLRVELTSSARQLLIERPVATGAAKDVFGQYNQPQVMAHGELAGGALRYHFSYADGAANLDALQELDGAAESVQSRGWGNAFIGRLELSPLGFRHGKAFIEKKRDDTGIGAEDHLSFGIDGGWQRDIRYATDAAPDARLDTRLISVDLAGRYTFGLRGTVTGQAAYIDFKREFNYKEDERPHGGYLQAGYLLPWTLLRGRVEPALRYELFDHDRIEHAGESGSKERILSIGLNHYLAKHGIKWAYNFVHARFDRGVAEAANSRNRDTHQLQLQLYF